MSDQGDDVTALLERLRDGDSGAERALIDCLYADLHRLAANYMRHERPWHTIQPTALVNEAYVKLIDKGSRNWRNRGHFMAAAAVAMRRILIDYARSRLAERRGGGSPMAPLDEDAAVTMQRPEELIALDRALEKLAAFDPELARLVEWRFFGGLTDDEAAQLLGVSPRTIKRRWGAAKAWLYGELNGNANAAAG